MLFNIEYDAGDRISGYLVPDNYSDRSTLLVTSEERELLRMTTWEPRPSLVIGRRHETGLCGFTIDRELIPDIETLTDLSMWDADSGVMIYRRPVPSYKNFRMFRLETHLLPLWKFDKAVGNHFCYSYRRLENSGRETIEQIFHLTEARSLYASGRVFLRHFEHLIDAQKLKMVTMLQNPHYELAERLLILNRIGLNKNNSVFGTRDTIIFEEAVEFVAEINLQDEKALRRAFRRMPDSVAALLSNPVVRSLSAQSQEEPLYSGNIASALDTLASFAVVGLRAQQRPFSDAVAALLDVPELGFPPPEQFSIVAELGEMLCHINRATDLIGYDLELYSHALTAVEKALQHEPI